jgi:hypothetical protein
MRQNPLFNMPTWSLVQAFHAVQRLPVVVMGAKKQGQMFALC